MSKIIARISALLALLVIHPGSLGAQQPGHPPAMNVGDAVVTGFSGTLAPDPTKPRPASKSAVDLTFINPDGPSARIVGLGQPGFVWDGRLLAAPKSFDVFAKDVGQVFGIALDDQTPPNIYLAATSVFGLQIVSRGRDGLPERRKKGGPGAGWMKGQFGLELQGGPGSIYKVDGRTGVVSLLANVTLDGVPNPGPGLGNLAYDAAHKQLFVSDLYTGMIHRFALDGKDLGPPYDHGATARPAGTGALAPTPFDPRNRPNIASDRFDSENPNTWGFAPPARRVWGLAVHDGRLYYSARNGSPTDGPQIWSVGIRQDGSFAADAQWELDVPNAPRPYPVSDIAFSQQGAMILAQRAPMTASYDYSAFTLPGEPQVLRYWLEQPDNPSTPSRWIAVPEEYAIGFAGNYRNTNGGVALGYGYGQDGMLNVSSCEAALWTTGQNLRNNPALRSRLEPGGPFLVHGLQGSPADMVRNANTPPATSYFIDYDDKFDDPAARSHIGSVRVYTTPCAPAASVGPVAAAPITPPPISCVGPNCRNVCTPTCVCPPDTVLEGKECVKQQPCPPPQVLDPATGACKCPPRTVLEDGKCVPVVFFADKCQPPMVPGAIPGSCVCPPDMATVNGQCVPVRCVPPLVFNPITQACGCPQGSVMQDGKCVPQICQPPLVPGPCVNGTPIDLGIEKTGATTPVQEPFYVFDITVTNHGSAIPANTVTVTDTVPPNMTYNSVGGAGWTCVPSGGAAGTVITCTYGPAVTPGQVLPPIHIDATATGPAPYPPVTNCAVVGTTPGSGYIDINPANDQACVTVTKRFVTLVVEKKVKNNTQASTAAIHALVFQIGLACGSPSTLNTSFGLHDGDTHTESNIPYGSLCGVTESVSNLPAAPKDACPQGSTAVWQTPVITPPSPGVNVTLPVTNFTVVNELNCIDKPSVVDVGIAKTGPTPVAGSSAQAFTLTVTNVGAPINVPGGGLTVTDTVTGVPGSIVGLTWTPVGDWNCTLTSGTTVGCTYLGSGPISTGQVIGTITVIFQPYTAGPYQNCAAVGLTPASGLQDTNPSNDTSCVTVGHPQVGTLIVKKEVTSNTAIPLPANTPFAMTITCGAPPLTASFNLTANGSYTLNNIPFNNTCTVAETLPPLPANLCPQGTVAAWDPPPTYTPPSVVISGTTATITVHNSVRCEEQKLGTLSVTKSVAPDPRGIGLTLTFPMTVTCTNPNASYPLNVHGNTSTVPFNVPIGSHCSVTETLPAPPKGCTWLAPIYSPANVIIASGLNQEMVTNGYRCTDTCPPPQVMHADGICGCPPPMVTGAVPGTCVCPEGSTLVNGKCVTTPKCQPPMVPNAVGVCGCPQGTVQKGNECVRQIVCRAPLVPNAAGTECVCRSGTVPRGGKCVEPIECRAPARLNRSGTACTCPSNMVLQGNSCVPQERKQRDVVPDRIIPHIGIPGIEGPHGGHGGAVGPGGGDHGSGLPGRH